MKDWFAFIAGNKRMLNFGFFFSFFSAFGQSFFISLFVPYWVEFHDITNATFGSVYAGITVASATLLAFTGRFIDAMPLSRFSFGVFGGLMIAVALLSLHNSFLLFVVALLLIRYFGQGLMTHTSATAMAVHFEKTRGKALGFTALGQPAGQLILPLLVLPLILLSGWREALLYIAAFALITAIPTIIAVKPLTENYTQGNGQKNDNKISIRKHFKNLQFWIITLNLIVIPFLCTAIFLYQYAIGLQKGWDASWIAISFTYYAVFNALFLLISGSLVDKFSGTRLFPLYLLPTLLGLLIMSFIDSKWAFPVFYSLLGISTGLGFTIGTATQVEIYGKANLGQIRSYFSTILVLSTALAPPLFGYFMDISVPVSKLMGFNAAAVFIIILLSFLVKKND